MNDLPSSADPTVHEMQQDNARGMQQARYLCDEILTKLDDVYGIVLDGPGLSDEQMSLLGLLPDEDLRQIVAYAEEYAANVADYGRVCGEVLRAKTARKAK